MSELYHHGIKGMRWGVRRYQNSDGSYTSAGKTRYRTSSSSGKYPRIKQPQSQPRGRTRESEEIVDIMKVSAGALAGSAFVVAGTAFVISRMK